jgi:guanine deaminase
MKAYRAAILSFSGAGAEVQAHWQEDGLLVTGIKNQDPTREVIVAVGDYQTVMDQWARRQLPPLRIEDIEHLPGKILAPGFVDMHIHFPQMDVIGSPATGLLPWLENYTFPQEMKFQDPAHAALMAEVFLDEMLVNGVTTALTFATAHKTSVDGLFEAAEKRHLRLITGLCLMDQNAPTGLLQETEQSLRDTESLIERWHEVDRLGYAITPRFVPTSSEAQLGGAGELAKQYPSTWVQSHVSENTDEIAWVKALYPTARSYLSVYDDVGLLRERAVYAHCIHFDTEDRALMKDRQTAAAICPTSNLFLGSGYFDYAAAENHGFMYGLGSDVGGGTSFSPFKTMLGAFYVAQYQNSPGGNKPLYASSAQHLWWQHTAGAANALGLEGIVGNLKEGCEADFLVLDPQATPLLARRTAQANTLEELLFAMIVLGDDRTIAKTVVAKKPTHPHDVPLF